MQLRIFHRTRYTYCAPVRESYNELRLHPATEDKSRLEFFLINIHPPVRLRHFRDNFLNYVHYFELAEPHSHLSIEAQTTLNTTSQYTDEEPRGVSFAQLNPADYEMLSPFLATSRYVSTEAETWRLALDIKAESDCVFTTAQAIMSYIHTHWLYAPNTTTAATHMREVMASRQGVCQDFAHVMLGLCRALQIPARYVSGYLYNGPEDLMRGAQASHAWCEVYVPTRGWFGLDPTNNTLADERYIKIATGRDYEDAAPISGHFKGPSGVSSGLEVKLTIERLDGG